eukprot:5943578-Pleurochrysis_carterae.AAC.2
MDGVNRNTAAQMPRPHGTIRLLGPNRLNHSRLSWRVLATLNFTGRPYRIRATVLAGRETLTYIPYK